MECGGLAGVEPERQAEASLDRVTLRFGGRGVGRQLVVPVPAGHLPEGPAGGRRVGGGGWDWFAVELADGRDITVSRVRAADGSFPLVYGTLVGRDGSTTHLVREDFNVAVTDSWTSPATGARYPAGWTLAIPGQDLMIDLTPTVAQQELDTRATTGVTYWEGSQRVSARQGTTMIGGEAYVELTGYGPSG